MATQPSRFKPVNGNELEVKYTYWTKKRNWEL